MVRHDIIMEYLLEHPWSWNSAMAWCSPAWKAIIGTLPEFELKYVNVWLAVPQGGVSQPFLLLHRQIADSRWWCMLMTFRSTEKIHVTRTQEELNALLPEVIEFLEGTRQLAKSYNNNNFLQESESAWIKSRHHWNLGSKAGFEQIGQKRSLRKCENRSQTGSHMEAKGFLNALDVTYILNSFQRLTQDRFFKMNTFSQKWNIFWGPYIPKI